MAITPPVPSTGGAIWEWVPEVQWQHEVVRKFCVPPDADGYGAVIDQDLKPPQQAITVKGIGLADADITTLLTCWKRGFTYSVTDKRGTVWVGIVVSLTYAQINGSVKWTASIQLRI